MKYQPNRDYVSNDDIQTPPELARLIVNHFKPVGSLLEPCCGDGNFHQALCDTAPGNSVFWREIKAGHDFFDLELIEGEHRRFDWIITNPPWSQIRNFLKHSMTLANNIVFLLTVNHIWTKARLRDIYQGGFGIAEILLLDTPANFPQSGFQLGAVHIRKQCDGTPITDSIRLSFMNTSISRRQKEGPLRCRVAPQSHKTPQ